MPLNLAAVTSTLVDGTSKGIPADASLSIDAIGQQGWNILAGDTPLPAALLLRSAIEHNVEWMRRFTEMTGVRLCPHGKTSMAPQLFDLQLAAGAWGITAATVSHLHVYRRFGVQRILLANQLVDPCGLDFVLAELDSDPDFDFYCLVDSVENVEWLRRGILERGCSRPLQILLEIGQPGGRTGTRTPDQAIGVGRAVAAAGPILALRGVEGFEGVLEASGTTPTVARIGRLFDDMRAAAVACDQECLFAAGPIILSAGGSQYFDLPLTLQSVDGLSRPSEFVLRSGCYVTHDSSWFRDYAIEIEKRMPEVGKLGLGLQPAIEVWAYVQSMPEPGLALASMGKRDCSFDVHLPTPLKWHRAGEARPRPLEDHVVSRLNDHHCYLQLPADSPLRIGDKVGFGIAHPCTTFDRWSVLLLVDDAYEVVDGIKTFF